MADQQTSELARAIQDITEKAQVLVRDVRGLTASGPRDRVAAGGP